MSRKFAFNLSDYPDLKKKIEEIDSKAKETRAGVDFLVAKLKKIDEEMDEVLSVKWDLIHKKCIELGLVPSSTSEKDWSYHADPDSKHFTVYCGKRGEGLSLKDLLGSLLLKK